MVSSFFVSEGSVSTPPPAPVWPWGRGPGGNGTLPGGQRKVGAAEPVSVSQGLDPVAQQADKLPQHAH